MTIIRRRQLGYSGHVLRENGVEKDSLMGMIEGRARGRQRIKYMDSIRADIDLGGLGQVARLAEARRVAFHYRQRPNRHGTSVR